MSTGIKKWPAGSPVVLFRYKADLVWIKLNCSGVFLHPICPTRLGHLSHQRQGVCAQPQPCMLHRVQSRAGFHFDNSEYPAFFCSCKQSSLSTHRCSQMCTGIWKVPRHPTADGQRSGEETLENAGTCLSASSSVLKS